VLRYLISAFSPQLAGKIKMWMPETLKMNPVIKCRVQLLDHDLDVQMLLVISNVSLVATECFLRFLGFGELLGVAVKAQQRR
jgi:hypothetical protein